MLYPISSPSRLLMDLSGIWDFQLDDGQGFAQKWYASPLPNPIPMPVPAAYNDLQEGLDFREHRGWVFYQRKISLTAFVRGQRVVLCCDAVTHHARVYLNGRLICERQGGFLPFEAEITNWLLPGQENLLTIAADNTIDSTTLPVGGKAETGTDGAQKPRNIPNFDYFNYSGIIRPVRLYTTPPDYIQDIALTAQLEGPDALLHYEIDTRGKGACRIDILDEGGRHIAQGQGLSGTLRLEKVHLWQPGQAYLYQVRVTFGQDAYTLTYGVRTVQVEGTQFLINGRPFYFKGYGRHEDTFPAGRGLNLPMNVKDISLMKWQEANSFRTSHYPYSEEMMRLCDRESFVVIDETPAVGLNLRFGGGANFGGQQGRTFDPETGVQTQAHHRQVLEEMIGRDKNYACVVMWSIANEPDSSGEGAYEYFAPLFSLARKLDPQSRPCTLVSMQPFANPDAEPPADCTCRLSDVICLNRYYGWYTAGGDLASAEELLRRELDRWKALGKPLIFTEYGADTVLGLRDTLPTPYTEEYQVEYYRMNNRVFDQYDFVVGEQAWNFADFATSPSLLRVQGNRKGLFTRDRRPKLAAHYFRQRWHQIPDFDYKNPLP
ncbi:MAG: beta-glucuronidase [Bacteroidales bacterium]|nr:beta-glucuronidase [Bacteroidales bacterium]